MITPLVSLIAFQAKHPHHVVIKRFSNGLSCFQMKHSAFENLLLPLTIRGLFIDTETQNIKIRGYNKFYELKEKRVGPMSDKGPFEVWIKENGCLIFISVYQSSILITTKHECQSRYTEKAQEWLNLHLKQSGISEQHLIDFLVRNQVTLAFELCDDDFEEHVFEYPPEKRGLLLHGIIRNMIEFQCWDAASIEQFGTEFGFPVVKCHLFSALEEAKTFIQSHETHGYYQGRPIEGFVLRGHSLTGESHFIKFKFDQPYFLYREWRELTRTLRNKETLPAILQFDESGYYLEWLKQHVYQHPEFYDRSFPFKPITLRQKFLKEKSSLKCPLRRVIMPVGIVGCGKTSMGIFLHALASIIHLQNDNYKKTKNSDPFFKAIVHHLDAGDSIVYVDKNNHQSPMRLSMVHALKRRFPEIQFIVLDWQIEKEDKKRLADLCFSRIVNRGQNHQTLIHGGKVNVRSVIYQFMNNRDPVSADDFLYDLIIPMRIQDSVETNVKKVLVALGLPCPSDSEWIKAKSEWSQYRVEYHRPVKSKGIRYYGISINEKEIMSKVLEAAKQDANLWNILNELLDNNRIVSPLHVTLALNPENVNDITEDKKEKNRSLFDYYANAEYASETPIQLLKLVGTEYLLCVECKIEVETLNVYPHVTIGTISEDYKPWLSNQVLESGHYISVPMEGNVMGNIQPFSYL